MPRAPKALRRVGELVDAQDNLSIRNDGLHESRSDGKAAWQSFSIVMKAMPRKK